MAGAGWKLWTRERVPSADLQQYLQDQVVMAFDSSSQRDARLPGPADGMVAFIRDAPRLLTRVAGAWRVVWALNPAQVTTAVPARAGWNNVAGFSAWSVFIDQTAAVRMAGYRSNANAFTPNGTVVIGLVPEGFRPASTKVISVPVTTGADVQCDVRNTGEVIAMRGPAIAAAALFCFDGLSFLP